MLALFLFLALQSGGAQGGLQETAWRLLATGDDAGARAATESLKRILRAAPFVDSEPLLGATSPAKKVRFANGMSAVLKPSGPGCVDTDFRGELLAAALDEWLALGLVPTTVLRSVRGFPASVQYYVEDGAPGTRALTYRVLDEAHSYGPGYEAMWLLDYLLQNRDRYALNYLRRPSGQLVAIDHAIIYWPGESRWSRHPGVAPTLAAVRDDRRAALFPRGDRLARLRSLSAKALREATYEMVPPEVIAAVLQRRDDLIAAIDATVDCISTLETTAPETLSK